MRRTVSSFVLAMCLAAVGVGTALAAPPDKGCSPAFSPVFVDWEWEFGDGVPGPGENQWWDMTVAGLAAEGLTPADAPDLFGVGSVEAFYELVVLGIRSVDKDQDGEICFKLFPSHQNGTPLYFINVVNNNARSH